MTPARRRVGSAEVGPIGYGAMPLNWEYGTPVTESEAKEVVHRALDLGVTLIDTADSYGPFSNEELVGRCLQGRRDEAVISTKVGLVMTNPEPITYVNNGRPDHISESCDGSLERLGVEVIDLYTLHRADPDVPVEESVGAMARLVEQGKVRALGLSEVGVDTIERATSVHPISSVQSELSLWTRGALDEVVPWCEAHGVAFLPYSPLGRGFLTGRLDTSTLTPADFRFGMPRFENRAVAANQAIVDGIAAVASRHEATNSQIALAWLLARSASIVPIPGTKRIRYLEENAGAADIVLTPSDMSELDSLPEPVGARY
ncbi:MAG TPA: aldo/keto reductase [Acidimicrobiia bacterium]|nr:aldo/keto reductase [Acidimicrobiia bacterium]